MMMDVNQTYGDDHFTIYTDIEKKRIILVRALGLFMTKTQLQTAQAYRDIYQIRKRQGAANIQISLYNILNSGSSYFEKKNRIFQKDGDVF